MCKAIAVKLDNKHWYKHIPKSVETSCGGKVMILWNQQWQTERTIPNNQPDITIRDNVAISQDRNVIKKETEKILKYKNPTIEIQHIWNAKTKVVTVITGGN
jgi:hypothetical protein